ncbi:MAG: hypothetical protein ACP5OU_08900 [Methanothrix sp.]
MEIRAIRRYPDGSAGERISEGIRMAKLLFIFSAVFLSLLSSHSQSTCQEMILSAHENCSLGDFTLQVEDVDSQAAKVWLMISDLNGPLQTEVLGINDTLDWDNQTLTVTRIYAGEVSDLVFLKINCSS